MCSVARSGKDYPNRVKRSWHSNQICQLQLSWPPRQCGRSHATRSSNLQSHHPAWCAHPARWPAVCRCWRFAYERCSTPTWVHLPDPFECVQIWRGSKNNWGTGIQSGSIYLLISMVIVSTYGHFFNTQMRFILALRIRSHLHIVEHLPRIAARQSHNMLFT